MSHDPYYERKRTHSGIATHQKTGVRHYAQVQDGKVISILCSATVNEHFKEGTENAKRWCRRCCTIMTGSARGCYDYSGTSWGRGY
jgi:hypothetical protein